MKQRGRLIILEGPDCAGKTTMGRALAERHGFIYFHCTASKTLFPGLADYHQNILDNVHEINSQGHDVVLDRFWPSEYVYGVKIFRPDSNYPWKEFQRQVQEFRSHYVFCFSTKGLSRYLEGHKDPAHSLSINEYKGIYDLYAVTYARQNKSYPNSARLYLLENDAATEEMFHHYLAVLASWNR